MLGVSFDTPAENADFASKFDFPYLLLSDPDRTMGLLFEACDDGDAKYAKRLTYVVGPDGILEYAVDTQDPAAQAEEILMALREQMSGFEGIRFVSEAWSCDVPTGWVLDFDQGVASMYDPGTMGIVTINWFQKEGLLETPDVLDLVRDIPGQVGEPEEHQTVAFPLGYFLRSDDEGTEVRHWFKANEDLMLYVTFDGDGQSLEFVKGIVRSLVGYPERVRELPEA